MLAVRVRQGSRLSVRRLGHLHRRRCRACFLLLLLLLLLLLRRRRRLLLRLLLLAVPPLPPPPPLLAGPPERRRRLRQELPLAPPQLADPQVVVRQVVKVDGAVARLHDRPHAPEEVARERKDVGLGAEAAELRLGQALGAAGAAEVVAEEERLALAVGVAVGPAAG